MKPISFKYKTESNLKPLLDIKVEFENCSFFPLAGGVEALRNEDSRSFGTSIQDGILVMGSVKRVSLVAGCVPVQSWRVKRESEEHVLS